MTVADDLRAKIGAIEGRQIELSVERSEIAFAAHVEHSAKAVKRLTEINAEMAHLTNEAASLNAALAESGRRATAAAMAQSAEAEKGRAEKALPIVQRLAERGAAIDAAIAEYRKHYLGIDDDLAELVALGVPTPSRELMRVNLRRANDAARTGLDLKTSPVPPGQRRTFDFLLRGWAQPGLNWINTRLNSAARAA